MFFFRFISFAIIIAFSCQLVLAAGAPSEYLDEVGRGDIIFGEDGTPKARTGVRISDTYCPYGSVNCGVNENSDDEKNLEGEEGLSRYLMRLLGGILNFAAIAAVIMLIIAGIRFVIAMGNQEDIEASKKHIMYTLAGLCVIILSLVIVGNITDVVYETTDEGVVTLTRTPDSTTVRPDGKEPVVTQRSVAPAASQRGTYLGALSCTNGAQVTREAAYITANEGLKYKVYQPDGTDLLISGIGHKETGKGVSEDDPRDAATIMSNFNADLLAHRGPLKWAGYNDLSGIQQAVLLDMTFHAGNSNIAKFTDLQAAVRAKDNEKASREILLNSASNGFSDIYRDAGEDMKNTALLQRLMSNQNITVADIAGRATRNAYLMLNQSDATSVFDAYIKEDVQGFSFLCKNSAIDWNNPNQRVSQYFTVREVTLDDARRKPDPGSTQEKNILKLAAELDKIRDAWGSGIQITSWYRPPNINKEVGGAAQSQHISGLAADIKPTNGKMSEFQDFLKTHWSGGLGTGSKSFVHVDIRNNGSFMEAGNATPSVTWTYPSA